MFRAELTVFKKSTLALALAASLSVLAGAFFVGGFAEPFFAALGFGLSQLAILVWAARWRNNIWPNKKRGLVEADATGVRVDGQLVVPREKLRSGYFQPKSARLLLGVLGELDSTQSSVRLLDRFGAIQFETGVTLESQGVELLRALGLDASSRAMEFSGSAPTAATLGRQLLLWLPFFLSFLVAGVGAHATISPFLMVVPIALLLIPAKIRIGADGVLVRWLGWKRLTPFSEVASVTLEERVIVLRKKNGETVRIFTSPRRRSSAAFGTREMAHRDAVLARIQEAFDTFQEGGMRAEVAAMVAPAGRTIADWMRELRALRSGESAYRKASVPHDELWRVLEDPAATAAARAGAATVLAPTLDEAGRARVRVAAETTASPKLRVAFSRVVDSAPDEALEEALEEVLAADEVAQSKAPRA